VSSNRQNSSDATSAQPDGDDRDRTTSLPLLRSWPAVYLFVTGAFVVWVFLLTVLQRMFS